MRRRQPPRHIAEEGRHLGLDPGGGIDGPRPLQHLGSRLLLHPQPLAQRRRQGGEGVGHGFRQDARALAAAGDQHMDRPARLRGSIRPVGQGADVRPHRIADQAHPRLDARRHQPQVREGRRHRADIGAEPAVGPPQHRILLMQQRRPPLAQRRQQGRGRGIAAEAHHHRRIQPLQGRSRLEQAACNGHARLGHADRSAPGGGVQRDPFLGRKGLGIGLAPVIGGQHDPPATPRQLARQRLGRKHMPAGTPGGDDADPGCHTRCLPDAAPARHSLPLSSFRAKRSGGPEPSGAREREAVADTVLEQIAFGAAGFRPSPE